MDTSARFENVGEAAILTASILCAVDIIDLVYELDAQYRQDAVFVFSASARAPIQKLKDDAGQYLCVRGWKESRDTLFGHEVRLHENLPVAARGKYTIVFASRAYAAQQGWCSS